jgi:hypothetical protein
MGTKRKVGERGDQKTHQLLEEGYQARREEGASITKEFEIADLEGWDGYDEDGSVNP